MRIALCLYGQPRNAVNMSQYHFQNIINPNNCDVFIHSWYDPENRSFGKQAPGHQHRVADENIDKKLIEIYKPKKYLIEKPMSFSNSNMFLTEDNIRQCFDYGLTIPDFDKYRVNAAYSVWYSVHMCSVLKELYAKQNNFTYDAVISMRFDVCPDRPIKVENFDLSKYNYQDLNQPHEMISDWFGMSNNENMNTYANLFFNIEKHHNTLQSTLGIWCFELFVREQIKDIPKQKIDIGVKFF